MVSRDAGVSTCAERTERETSDDLAGAVAPHVRERCVHVCNLSAIREAQNCGREAAVFHRKKAHVADEPPPPPAHGRECLIERGLLAPWYVRDRLSEEMDRARRHERPLPVALIEPQWVGPDDETKFGVSASAARKVTRQADLVGWLDDKRIIVILPEATEEDARAALLRITNELWQRTQYVGGLKWRSTALVNASTFDSVEELVAGIEQP